MNVKQVIFSAHSSERNCNIVLAVTGFEIPWVCWMQDSDGNYHMGRYFHTPQSMEEAEYIAQTVMNRLPLYNATTRMTLLELTNLILITAYGFRINEIDGLWTMTHPKEYSTYTEARRLSDLLALANISEFSREERT